jgi:predicted ArsR family transcriptional regulator
MAKDTATISPRTRQALLQLLKENGPMQASQVAARLGVSAMAIRQHLYDLAGQKMIDFHDEPRPVGRPARVWRLTAAAEKFFPDAHALLTVRLIDAMRETFGREGIGKLVSARGRQQLAEYKQLIPAIGTLRARVKALARIRSQEGYMAEVFSQPDGTLLLVENHCPICAAATACQNLCSMELEVFREILGEGVSIERVEHIMLGARRCAYRIAIKK